MENKVKLKFNIMAVILIAIFAISVTPITLQNDTFYTIKIGEYILENGITMQDPFSWHENLPYTFPHWAYDVATYLVYNAGGYLGIYIATCALSALLGIAVYFTNTKLTKNNLISFVLTIGVIYLLKDYIAARAQLVTFTLFILTIFFIEKFLETKKKRYAAGLIIIPIIIANIHLAVWPFYFILFMPYIAEYIISNLLVVDIYFRNYKIKKLRKQLLKETLVEKTEELKSKIESLEKNNENSKNRREKIDNNAYKLVVRKNDNVKWLIIIMMICIFTGLLTPLHGTPYTYLIKTMEGNTTQFINEHLPLTLINDVPFMIVIIFFLAILLFTDTKIKLCDFFMIAGLLLLSFKTRRQTSMYILIGSVVLNRLITTWFSKYDRNGVTQFTKLMVSWMGKIITIMVMAILTIPMINSHIGNTFIDEAAYPTKAAEFIKENIDMSQMRLYNEYNYGSYLLMQDIPVFIDSRADLYTPEFNGTEDIFSDFIDTNNIGVYYELKFEEYKITHVILQKNTKLNMFISRDEKYKELYSDSYFVIYERGVQE
ncbi:MAG: TMF family protein [Clostridia bacterium]|nr:TMF family protein [Clostridia bacterium]